MNPVAANRSRLQGTEVAELGSPVGVIYGFIVVGDGGGLAIVGAGFAGGVRFAGGVDPVVDG